MYINTIKNICENKRFGPAILLRKGPLIEKPTVDTLSC